MASTLQTANKIVVEWPDQKIIELLREKMSFVPAGLLCLVLYTLPFLHKAPIRQKPWRSLVGSPWRLLPTSQRTERDATCQARTWPNCTLRKKERGNSLKTQNIQNNSDLLLGYRPKAIWLERVWRLESGLLCLLSLPRGERLLYSESFSSSLSLLLCCLLSNLSTMIDLWLLFLWQKLLYRAWGLLQPCNGSPPPATFQATK